MTRNEATATQSATESHTSARRPQAWKRIGLAAVAAAGLIGGAAACGKVHAQTPNQPHATAEKQVSPDVANAEHFLNRYDKVSVVGEPVATADGTKLTVHMDYQQSIEQARDQYPGVIFNQEDHIFAMAIGDKSDNPSVIYKFTQDGQSVHHQATADNPKDSRDTPGEIDAIMPGTPGSNPSSTHDNFELYASNGGSTPDGKHYIEVVDPIAAFQAKDGHWEQIPLPEADQHPHISVDGK